MMVTLPHHPMDGHSPSKIYQKELYYKLQIWHLDLTHKSKTRWQLLWMVSYHHQDGYPPFKGCLPTIKNLTEGNVLQTWNLAHRLNHKIKTRWQLPWMVGSHPLDVQPPSHRQGWSPSLRLVTHYPIAPFQILSPTIPSMVTHHPKLLQSDQT